MLYCYCNIGSCPLLQAAHQREALQGAALHSSPVTASHTLSVLSPEPERAVRPSEDSAQAATAPVCPFSVRRVLPCHAPGCAGRRRPSQEAIICNYRRVPPAGGGGWCSRKQHKGRWADRQCPVVTPPRARKKSAKQNTPSHFLQLPKPPSAALTVPAATVLLIFLLATGVRELPIPVSSCSAYSTLTTVAFALRWTGFAVRWLMRRGLQRPLHYNGSDQRGLVLCPVLGTAVPR